MVGLGPGSAGLLAPMALECLHRAGAVVGYDRYMDLVDPELLAGKTLFSSPMKKEMERTAKAVDFALSGLDTVVVLRTLLLNGIAGVVFGWLYWKRGLEMAMLSHFSADIVLHVIAPLFSPGASP